MANYALNIMSLLQNATAREFAPLGEQSPPVETMCLVAGTDEGSAEARWWRGCPLALKLGEAPMWTELGDLMICTNR